MTGMARREFYKNSDCRPLGTPATTSLVASMLLVVFASSWEDRHACSVCILGSGMGGHGVGGGKYLLYITHSSPSSRRLTGRTLLLEVDLCSILSKFACCWILGSSS